MDLVYDNGDRALDDDIFGDITFERLKGDDIMKLGTNLFSKTSHLFKWINLEFCYLRNSPPEHNIWKALGSLKNAKGFSIGLNVT